MMNPSSIFLITISLLSVVSVDACTPGYYKLKSVICLKCPKGMFQANPNRYGCRPCPPGKVSTKGGSINCTSIPKSFVPSKHEDRCVCKPGSERQGRKCKPCKPRTHLSSGYCSECDQGYFQPKEGQVECLKCPDGTLSEYAAIERVTCSEGEEISPDDGNCVICKAGESIHEYGGCVKCEANHYKPKPGKDPCLPCRVGTQSGPGARKCLPCPKGKVLFKTGKCRSYPAGKHFDTYNGKCVKCGFHKFTPYENVKSSCYSCGGKEFALKGASECVSCPKNQYLFENGKCKHCPQGSVCDWYSLKCNKCNVNDFARGDMTFCEPCPAGTYALPGSTTCFTCPKNSALMLAEKDCGTCLAGKYYSSYLPKCRKCSEGEIKPKAGVETECEYCPDGTKANREQTKCIAE